MTTRKEEVKGSTEYWDRWAQCRISSDRRSDVGNGMVPNMSRDEFFDSFVAARWHYRKGLVRNQISPADGRIMEAHALLRYRHDGR